jgi:hypothetical protein
MAIIISRMYVALLGLGEITIIWRPLCSCCVSLRMLSSLNTFLRTGYLFLFTPNLPPSSPPCLGCGSVILLQSSISWHLIQFITFIPLIVIHALLLRTAFIIFATAESTVVVCGQSTGPFLIVFMLAHHISRILGVQFVVVSPPFH